MANLADSLLWPCSRLGEVANALLRAASPLLATPPPNADIDALGRWLESAALTIGFEAQPAETTYADFESDFPHIGPAMLHVPTDSGPKFLAILPGSTLLTPALKKVRVDPAVIRAALCAAMEAPILREIDETLRPRPDPAGKTSSRTHAILRERLGAKRIRGIWLLRLPPGANFWRSTAPRPHPPALDCARQRPCGAISALDPGLVHCRRECFARRNGSRMAGSLGSAPADAGPAARADHAIARLGRHRRRRALEAAALLRLAPFGARQHPPSRRRATARTSARIGSRRSAGH